jgi:protein TonB
VAARRNGEEGTVLLRVLVTPDGKAGKVELDRSSGSAVLDQAAAEAVSRWRFVPARRDAEAVEAWVVVPMVFRLEAAN